VIITFFPEDDSEEKQILGRTCRQDNPGSARKVPTSQRLFVDETWRLSVEGCREGVDCPDPTTLVRGVLPIVRGGVQQRW